jgi:hypothetical protein
MALGQTIDTVVHLVSEPIDIKPTFLYQRLEQPISEWALETQYFEELQPIPDEQIRRNSLRHTGTMSIRSKYDARLRKTEGNQQMSYASEVSR